MKEIEKEILNYFGRADHSGKQIKIVSELVDQPVEYVITVLQKYGRIPNSINKKNYRKYKGDHNEITEDLRRYIVGSMKDSWIIANELHLSYNDVERIRKEAKEIAKGRAQTISERHRRRIIL